MLGTITISEAAEPKLSGEVFGALGFKYENAIKTAILRLEKIQLSNPRPAFDFCFQQHSYLS